MRAQMPSLLLAKPGCLRIAVIMKVLEMKETDLQCICAKGSAQKDSVRAVSVSVSHCETLPGVRSEPRLPLLRPALQATIEVSMLLQKPRVGQGKRSQQVNRTVVRSPAPENGSHGPAG